MSRAKKKRRYYITLVCTRELREKAKRLADADLSSVSTIVRKLVAQAAEPK
jgi:hypothetical protein